MFCEEVHAFFIGYENFVEKGKKDFMDWKKRCFFVDVLELCVGYKITNSYVSDLDIDFINGKLKGVRQN